MTIGPRLTGDVGTRPGDGIPDAAIAAGQTGGVADSHRQGSVNRVPSFVSRRFCFSGGSVRERVRANRERGWGVERAVRRSSRGGGVAVNGGAVERRYPEDA